MSSPWPAPDPLTRVDLVEEMVRLVAPWPAPDPSTRVDVPFEIATRPPQREPIAAGWGRRIAAGAMALAAVIVSITAVALAF